MGEGRARSEAFQRYPGEIKDIVIPAKAGEGRNPGGFKKLFFLDAGSSPA
jgi:hypothetical protein